MVIKTCIHVKPCCLEIYVKNFLSNITLYSLTLNLLTPLFSLRFYQFTNIITITINTTTIILLQWHLLLITIYRLYYTILFIYHLKLIINLTLIFIPCTIIIPSYLTLVLYQIKLLWTHWYLFSYSNILFFWILSYIHLFRIFQTEIHHITLIWILIRKFS